MAVRTRTIVGDDDLYRRFAKGHLNPADGAIYFSALLRNRSDDPRKKEPDPQLSVYLADLVSPRRCLALAGKRGQGVAALRAEIPLTLGLTVEHTPEEDPTNPAHCTIRGNEGQKARQNCVLLAEELSKRILVYPEGAAVPKEWTSPPEAVLGEWDNSPQGVV